MKLDWDVHVQHGIQLASKNLYHCALEIWKQLLQVPSEDQEKIAEIYDEMGKVYIQLAENKQALECFSQAVSLTSSLDREVRYSMHLASTYARMSDYDRAERMFTQLLPSVDRLSPILAGNVYANLAVVQSYNEFYSDSVTNTVRSLHYFNQAGTTAYHKILYTNLGYFYLELGDYDKAEQYLVDAIELPGGPVLAPISESSRVCMLNGMLDQSIAYAQQVLDLVWASITNYEKEEIARICELLARLAYHFNERQTALRLIEKAQLLFGQLGEWRQWRQAQKIMDDWLEASREQASRLAVPPAQVHQINRFIGFLDIMNAQELIHENFSKYIDCRVMYAKTLAESMSLSEEELDWLIHACRFADYGLTALEAEVVSNPMRSDSAWKQFKEHPLLSLQMLQIIEVPTSVLNIIQHHHENFDGTGYPHGVAGEAIPRLARVLAVVDHYAFNVSVGNKTHSETIQDLRRKNGTMFDPVIVETFERIFHN